MTSVARCEGAPERLSNPLCDHGRGMAAGKGRGTISPDKPEAEAEIERIAGPAASARPEARS